LLFFAVRTAYDDFGNLATNSTETIANPFRYVGKFGVQTDLPDLLYMRARYYVPSVGRFITHDPIGGLNLYAYVGNNPINFMDPKGEQSVIEGVAIPAAIIAIIAATIAYLSNNSKRRYYEIRVDSKPRECPKAPRDPCVVMTIACVGALQQKHFGAAFLYCAVMAVVCGMRIFFR
jgi:RHS repeat-associated protein